MVWYLDTSAFLKLMVAESESRAMREWCMAHGPIWSSQLLQTEALRAASRLGIEADVVHGALDAVALILPSAATFAAAGQMRPTGLRSLDALHLATALELGGDLDGIVAYDGRMVEAATMASVNVVQPA